jgi:hypothetical protein
MIIGKKEQAEYKRATSNRFNALLDIFDGTQATDLNRFHGIRGKGEWRRDVLNESLIINSSNLRLAISDLESILKELKQLAK